MTGAAEPLGATAPPILPIPLPASANFDYGEARYVEPVPFRFRVAVFNGATVALAATGGANPGVEYELVFDQLQDS